MRHRLSSSSETPDKKRERKDKVRRIPPPSHYSQKKKEKRAESINSPFCHNPSPSSPRNCPAQQDGGGPYSSCPFFCSGGCGGNGYICIEREREDEGCHPPPFGAKSDPLREQKIDPKEKCSELFCLEMIPFSFFGAYYTFASDPRTMQTQLLYDTIKKIRRIGSTFLLLIIEPLSNECAPLPPILQFFSISENLT